MSARHLYVHVPFCARRCTYCDFSIAVRRSVPVDDYLEGLSLELRNIPDGNVGPLETVYLGGGTPSRLGVEGIRRLVQLLREHFAIAADAEVTLEANPEDVFPVGVKGWRENGINRLSIGVQSFNDATLRWMHRVHDSGQAQSAVLAAREGGIINVSIDLIFALPAECDRSWRADLEQAIALSPSHISLYGLTVESRTPLDRMVARKEVIEADEDRYASEFLLADQIAGDAGFEHYEVSNFAKPGMQSRHNSAYWSGAPYLGIGPSAHSFDGLRRHWNRRDYAGWLQRVREGGGAREGEELLSAANRASEDIYLGLRTRGGYGVTPAELEKVRPWEGSGWAVVEDGRVRLTPEGWLRLDALASGLTGS